MEIQFPGNSLTSENSLTGLLGQFKTQVRESNWLSVNTTEKFAAENPDFSAAGFDLKDMEIQISGNSSANNLSFGTSENSLTSLLSQMKTQIRDSDWLSENTPDKFEAENPDLVKNYKDAAGIPK